MNPWPLGPEPSAIPNFATPRWLLRQPVQYNPLSRKNQDFFSIICSNLNYPGRIPQDEAPGSAAFRGKRSQIARDLSNVSCLRMKTPEKALSVSTFLCRTASIPASAPSACFFRVSLTTRRASVYESDRFAGIDPFGRFYSQ